MNRILVVNAGSSTLKLSAIGPDDDTIAAVTLQGSDPGSVERFCAEHGPFDASGHRIVHGGNDLTEPVVLDDRIIGDLENLTPLAPLHQKAGLAGVLLAMGALPGVPAVACFDTAFHAALPAAAATYPIPAHWRALGIRRFGFHGLSYAWSSRRAAEILGAAETGWRVVICHLGSGSSACAVLDGRSVDTTMGFTPAEGLVMATRSGTVDPGLILWLIRTVGVDPADVDDALEHASGLAGLSGGNGDMRSVGAAADRGEPAAELARDVWVHRLRQAIAAMAASLGGIDALVFTGGIGEHLPALRALVVDGLAFLGLALDAETNSRTTTDGEVTGTGAVVRTAVVTAREDLQIARLVRARLADR